MRTKISILLLLGLFIIVPALAQKPNEVTKAEKKAGWKSLFDGKTFRHLFDAFGEQTVVSFRVKAHPMAPPDYLRGMLQRMPAAFTTVAGELASHLRESACAVVLASTSAFELAVAGHTSEDVAAGIGALRTHASTAHGQARKVYRLAPRHARLAVNAAHTIALFVTETWDAKRARVTVR